jgi:hypothetical protein
MPWHVALADPAHARDYPDRRFACIMIVAMTMQGGAGASIRYRIRSRFAEMRETTCRSFAGFVQQSAPV